MKKTLATISALLVALTCFGQTIDYTGVSINTERVKKVYEKRMTVFLTVAGEYNSYQHAGTGEVGARFAWVKHFGFYVGAEVGITGIPSAAADWPSYYGTTYQLSGQSIYDANHQYVGTTNVTKTRYPRATFSAGGVMQLSKSIDLFLGSGVMIGGTQRQYSSSIEEIDNYLRGRWFDDDSFFSPAAEVGAFFHFGKVALMTGFTFVPARYNNTYKLTLGVGYTF